MARNADRISRASLISAALLLVWSVPCLALTEPRPSEVRRWADAQAVHHDALREKLREIDDGYEVLFIPGFMGSMEKTNFPQKALATYAKAAELNNAAAAKNLRALKSRLGQAKKSR